MPARPETRCLSIWSRLMLPSTGPLLQGGADRRFHRAQILLQRLHETHQRIDAGFLRPLPPAVQVGGPARTTDYAGVPFAASPVITSPPHPTPRARRPKPKTAFPKPVAGF